MELEGELITLLEGRSDITEIILESHSCLLWRISRGVLSYYRPVSNLPLISKIIEKNVVNQVIDNLHRYYLFEDFQSGFILQLFTVYTSAIQKQHCCVEVTKDLLVASDSGCMLILVLFDHSAALDHSIVLQRLEHVIGIKETALACFNSHLSDRFECFHINEKFLITPE